MPRSSTCSDNDSALRSSTSPSTAARPIRPCSSPRRTISSRMRPLPPRPLALTLRRRHRRAGPVQCIGPRPAGAAARRAERPTRVTGTIRPDPGSSWSPRSRQTPAWPSQPAGAAARRNELDAGALSGRVVFPPGEGIGRTRPGAGSRPRRGRFRPPDRHNHWQLRPGILAGPRTSCRAILGTAGLPWMGPSRGP
jgi:hypothetical protein